MSPSQFSRDKDPTVLEHLAGAEANLRFAAGLHVQGEPNPTAVGWAITSLFYGALHIVRAYLLAAKNVRVARHEEMRDLYNDYPELNRTKVAYDFLKQQSQSARYYLNQRFTWKDYPVVEGTALSVKTTWEPKIRQLLGS